MAVRPRLAKTLALSALLPEARRGLPEGEDYQMAPIAHEHKRLPDGLPQALASRAHLRPLCPFGEGITPLPGAEPLWTPPL
ncbi:hypothetical protein [Thermus amyloliquefaciens]|uniref:hypothetical protein n=1 Tax=Thermus amyloliquefaciens TaxID=1449080 RepID=UPI000571465B|nr:hypothetical protein [Thermus amyloliquefaciens]